MSIETHFYFLGSTMMLHNQIPKSIHICSNVFPPLYITQRRALHSGETTANGEYTIPTHVSGTHR